MTMLGLFCCCADAGQHSALAVATPASRPRNNFCVAFMQIFSSSHKPVQGGTKLPVALAKQQIPQPLDISVTVTLN
jgi:hypothetical protein